MVHIDWLSIRQEHGSDLGDWGASRRLDLDLETGEIQTDRVLSDSLEASWSTSLRLRVQGGCVEMEGNPSKWGRLDAVFGLGTMAEAVEVYNSVLRDRGLPEFTTGERIMLASGDSVQSGARITRVDLTRNLITGTRGVRPFLDWIEAQTWGHRIPFRRSAHSTCSAGARSRRQRILYDKALELLANRDKWKRSRAFEKEEAIGYLDALVAWCEAVGLLRDEIRLGRKWLNEHPAKWLNNWGGDTVTELFAQQCEIATLEAGAMQNYGDEIQERLAQAGYSERMSGAIARAVSSWLSGQDWSCGLSKPTRYRYLAALREHCGLDLRKPCNVRALATVVKPKVLEARAATASDVPEWYRLRRAA